ncbi:hypothetical protein LTS10_008468 [Elasticomyces elasticus]|nr:hypothetical protein LTS10_008468 [Elasticomyces elasticus]
MPTVIDLTADDVIDLTADDTSSIDLTTDNVPSQMDKLTLELRTTIYRHVLSTKRLLRRCNEDYDYLFNTALIGVSKRVHTEALHVFYYCNTFQLESTNDLHDSEVMPLAALPCLRHLELLNEPIASFLRSFRAPQRRVERGLASLNDLPKLQTVTLAYGQYAKSGSIISNSLQRHGLLDMFEWTDIGVLSPKRKQRASPSR